MVRDPPGHRETSGWQARSAIPVGPDVGDPGPQGCRRSGAARCRGPGWSYRRSRRTGRQVGRSSGASRPAGRHRADRTPGPQGDAGPQASRVTPVRRSAGSKQGRPDARSSRAAGATARRVRRVSGCDRPRGTARTAGATLVTGTPVTSGEGVGAGTLVTASELRWGKVAWVVEADHGLSGVQKRCCCSSYPSATTRGLQWPSSLWRCRF